MSAHKKKLSWLVVLLIVSLVLAACGSDDGDEKESDNKNTAEKTDVTFQLAWTHEYSSAPFYAAIENGHFEDANLNVTLVSGGFTDEGYIQPIDEVLAEDNVFGLTSTYSLIEARANDKPVVAISTVMQRSPFALISLSEDNITTPADLVGKTITVADGPPRIEVEALLAQQGIGLDEVTIVSRTSFGVDPLINQEVDVLAGWIINEGIQVQEAGFEPNFILLSDYGIDEYSFIVFTTEKMINEQPEIVNAVVDAISQGMQDVIDDPEKTIDLVMKYAPDLDRAQQLNRLYAMLPLLNLPNTPLGQMDEVIWTGNVQLMVDNDVIAESVDPSEAYTNRFVEGN